MNINKKKIYSLLVEPGYISAKDFKNAQDIASSSHRNIVDILIEKGLIKDSEYGQLIAQKINFPFINLQSEKTDDRILNMIPEPLARARKIIVFARDKDYVKIAMNNPNDLEMRHFLSKRTGAKIKIYYATKQDIEKALWQYKSSLREEIKRILVKINTTGPNSAENNAYIMALEETILSYAQNSRASDVHIEPYTNQAVVRFRIDGVMHRVASFPKKILPFVLTRVKILAKMKIDEHMSAQDGKFQFKVNNENIDVRVSIVPVSGGENIVLRLLSNKNRQISLSNLGFNAVDLKKIKKAIKNPHGMILVTGPTGSGKTTTVYEMIKNLNTEKVHIATIEDPVEYNIEGISQIQVNKRTNLSFANGLRAIVRQDPDIIMVGEIRDKETASIAVNSAMTGHLVFSTLHTNDAATALPRLIDMKIEAFLIASTVNVIIAQRLLRLLCKKCRYSYSLSNKEIADIDMIANMREMIEKKYSKNLKDITWYKGEGCKACSGSGYSGRIGIYEVLPIDEDVKKLVINHASSYEITKKAIANGMTTILEDGIDKAVSGLTAISEVIRVIME